MKKYSKAVSEMYSQFKQRKTRPLEKYIGPLEKYIGRLANYHGEKLEVVGYRNDTDGTGVLIVDGAKIKGWCWKVLGIQDVVFKKCEGYYYVGISDLMD